MKLTKRQRRNEGALQSGDQGFWSPLGELARLRNQIHQAFESPFEDFLAPVAGLIEGWTPAFDLYEDKDKFTVKAELPGMKKEDLDITLDGDTLTISGERKREEEQKEGNTYRSERFFGRFQRSLTLPQPVDLNKIQASYKDGILMVELPKSEEAKRKQIEVKVG